MTRALILLLIVMFALPALGRSSRKKSSSGLNDKDPATDFSAHFDEEVKYQREHPQVEEGEAPPPKKKRKSHRKKKKKSEAPAEENIDL